MFSGLLDQIPALSNPACSSPVDFLSLRSPRVSDSGSSQFTEERDGFPGLTRSHFLLLLSPEDSSRGSVTSSPGCGPRPPVTAAHTAVERRPLGPSHLSLARILHIPQQGPSLPTIHPTPVNKPPNPDPPPEAAPAPRTPAPVLGVPSLFVLFHSQHTWSWCKILSRYCQT